MEDYTYPEFMEQIEDTLDTHEVTHSTALLTEHSLDQPLLEKLQEIEHIREEIEQIKKDMEELRNEHHPKKS